MHPPRVPPRSRWSSPGRSRRFRCLISWRRRRAGWETSRSRTSMSPAMPTPCACCSPATPTSASSARSTSWRRSTPAPASAPSIPGSRSAITVSRFIMANPDEAAAILHERLPDLDLPFLSAVVRDLNSENVWGVDGGLDPAIEEFTAELNMKLGNLPVAAPAKDVLEPRFVERALAKLGTYQKK